MNHHAQARHNWRSGNKDIRTTVGLVFLKHDPESAEDKCLMLKMAVKYTDDPFKYPHTNAMMHIPMTIVSAATEIYDLGAKKCHKNRLYAHNSPEAEHEANFYVFDDLPVEDSSWHASYKINQFFGRTMTRVESGREPDDLDISAEIEIECIQRQAEVDTLAELAYVIADDRKSFASSDYH